MTEQSILLARGRDTTQGAQWFFASLFVLVAICSYLHVPLVSGGRLLVPSFPVVALGPILYLAARPAVTRTDELFLPKVIFLLVLSIVLSPGYLYVSEKILGLIQCVMAIVVAVLTVRLMQRLRVDLLERSLLIVWIGVIVGCLLEVVGLTTEASDSFREWAYASQYTLYDSDSRDMNLVGWPRPKLFSVEPSHVTKLFVASLNAWLLVRLTWRKVVFASGATLAMILIMGSPMLFVSAAITSTIVLWDRETSARKKAGMILGALLIGMCFVYFYGDSTYSRVVDRLESVGQSSLAGRLERAGSEEQRMVFPYITLAETWLRWPAFGVGVGGKEVVIENSSLRVARPESALGNNALAEIGIYLGVVGSLWFFSLLRREAKETNIRRIGMFFTILALFSQLMGGMVSFQYWGFIALLWGALSVADGSGSSFRPGIASES